MNEWLDLLIFVNNGFNIVWFDFYVNYNEQIKKISYIDRIEFINCDYRISNENESILYKIEYKIIWKNSKSVSLLKLHLPYIWLFF